MREKRFKNSPKGRSEIPEKSGEYMLLDKQGNTLYRNRANNLRRKIKEEHYDKTKVFSFIKIRYGNIKELKKVNKIGKKEV